MVKKSAADNVNKKQPAATANTDNSGETVSKKYIFFSKSILERQSTDMGRP